MTPSGTNQDFSFRYTPKLPDEISKFRENERIFIDKEKQNFPALQVKMAGNTRDLQDLNTVSRAYQPKDDREGEKLSRTLKIS